MARTTDPRTRRGAREQEILEVAGRIFYERGYQGTTIVEIANAVRLLKGSLYHYIDSKEDLLFRVIYEAHKDSLEAIRMKLIGLEALDAIHAYITESVLFVARHPEQSGVFYSEYRHLTGDHLAKILDLRNENEGLLNRLVRRAQEDGHVRSDVDPKLLTLHIIGSITALPNWYRPDGAWGPELVADTYANLARVGFLKSTSGPNT